MLFCCTDYSLNLESPLPLTCNTPIYTPNILSTLMSTTRIQLQKCWQRNPKTIWIQKRTECMIKLWLTCRRHRAFYRLTPQFRGVSNWSPRTAIFWMLITTVSGRHSHIQIRYGFEHFIDDSISHSAHPTDQH